MRSISPLVLLAAMGLLSCAESVPRTVLFFGDSLTAGTGVAADEAYPAVVQRLARQAGRDIVAVNEGVSGNTSGDGERRVERALDRPRIDVFVLALGANDFFRHVPPSDMELHLNHILDRVQKRHPEARLVVAGVDFRRTPGLATPPAAAAVFDRVARGHGATLVPNLLSGVAGRASMNQPDHVHPTAAGHRIMAERLWLVIGPLLKR